MSEDGNININSNDDKNNNELTTIDLEAGDEPSPSSPDDDGKNVVPGVLATKGTSSSSMEDHTEATHDEMGHEDHPVEEFKQEQPLPAVSKLAVVPETPRRVLPAGFKLALALLAIVTAIVIPIVVIKHTTKSDSNGKAPVVVVIDDNNENNNEKLATLQASPTACGGKSKNVLDQFETPVRVALANDVDEASSASWIRVTGTGDLMLLTAAAAPGSSCSGGISLQVYQGQEADSNEDCGEDYNNILSAASAVRGETFTETCPRSDSSAAAEPRSVFMGQTDHDHDLPPQASSVKSTANGVYWQSLKGQKYHVKIDVTQYNKNSDTEEVVLTLQSYPAATPDVISNHFCLGATGPIQLGEPLTVSSSSSSSSSSTTGGTSVVWFVAKGGQQINPAPVRLATESVFYYKVMGTGQRLTADFPCSPVLPTVIRGDSCETVRTFIPTDGMEIKSCEADNNGGAAASFSGISWMSNPYEEYILQLVLTTTASPVELQVTVTEMETPPPPEVMPAPENDLCDTAIALSFDDADASALPKVVTTTGTTAFSTFEDLGYSRYNWGSGFGFADDFVDQPGQVCDWSRGPGVWYSVTGRGQGIRASTCSGSTNEGSAVTTTTTTLAVYQGSDCASLNCVVNYGTHCEANSDGDDNRHYYYGDNTVEWFGEAGTTYYIYVKGNDDDDAQEEEVDSTFTLELTEFPTPPNDVCDGADLLDVGSTTTVSTEGATAEFIGNHWLRDYDGVVFPGVFFNVVGTGEVLKVATSACDDAGSPTVHVYQSSNDDDGGDSDNNNSSGCHDKQIVGQKVVCDASNGGSAAYWESEPGKVYHILYQSDTTEPKTLSITEERPTLNDLCTGAIALEPGSVTSADTSIARFSQYYRRHRHRRTQTRRTMNQKKSKNNLRNMLSFAPPGLYYTVQGTGKPMQLSTPCEDTDGVSFHVSAGSTCQERRYSGYLQGQVSTQCGEPLPGNDNNADTAASSTSLTWPTLEGQLYYIEVQNWNGPGQFSITLTELDDDDT